MNKVTYLLAAMTLFLGCLLAVLTLGFLGRPAVAQSTTDGQIKGVSALTVGIGSSRELLVVFKEIKNPDTRHGDFENVTSMTVYDFVNANQGRADLVLVANRTLEYDFQLIDWNNPNGQKWKLDDTIDYYQKQAKQMKKIQEDQAKEREKKERKDREKEKDKEEKKDEKK